MNVLILSLMLATSSPFTDQIHSSKVFNEPRTYRIFLPVGYESTIERYPVIYYFHGHSDRYTLERYDDGKDTVPKISDFVRKNKVIVVSVDGYVAKHYTGFYGGTPWDVRIDGGDYDFGEYFLELIQHIDHTYRTLTGRRYRATSGLSMGGFMSAYLSARYPDLIGSASIFNPGPEFYVGEPGRRSLWRPKDHITSHDHSMVRLVRASGDYISQYHEETRAAYARSKVNFEFRQDEYHRHAATSIGETFDFHQRAFGNPSLDTKPEHWNYTSAHQSFHVWGYQVEAKCSTPAYIRLANVTQGYFRIDSKEWLPDGKPADCSYKIRTAPLYQPGSEYRIIDLTTQGKINMQSTARKTTATPDQDGCLLLDLSPGAHEVSFFGPGAGAEPPVLLPYSNRFPNGTPVHLPISIYNPRGSDQDNVSVSITSNWPTVKIIQGKKTISKIASGSSTDLSKDFLVEFTAGGGDFERASLQVQITYDDWHSTSTKMDAWITPDHLKEPLEFIVLDGREKTFDVFRQQGNQGGGARIQRTVKEGKGNGNGKLEPGEEATIWLKLHQGIDPFDKGNWCRAKVYVESGSIEEIADIQEEKQREWTGAQNRTSLIRRNTNGPASLILDCESYSFRSSPDVHYGTELLYQPYQIHQHHLFRIQLP